MRKNFFAILLFFAGSAQARFGGHLQNLSSEIGAENGKLRKCALEAVYEQIHASKAPDIVIDGKSLSINKCLYYDCFNLKFNANTEQADFTGKASVIVTTVDGYGDPDKCYLYQDYSAGDISPSSWRYCDLTTAESLNIVNKDGVTVVQGCAYSQR